MFRSAPTNEPPTRSDLGIPAAKSANGHARLLTEQPISA